MLEIALFHYAIVFKKLLLLSLIFRDLEGFYLHFKSCLN